MSEERQKTTLPAQKDFFEQYYASDSIIQKMDLSFKYIIEKLKDGSISAIIGAVFSKNANKNFPNWPSLLVDAYLEMHPEITQKTNEPDTDFKKRIQATISKAQEPVIAAEYMKFKGCRESLDLYIENCINTVEKEQLNLETHKKLLHLNWCDIITTNWDHLLEKAKEDKHFVVEEAKELKKSNRNRIIKIHGSIRSESAIKTQTYEFDGCFDHLYVITEKDYTDYAIKHEGFSNFMKVKILENAFCLFGFSGKDSNFQYWVKELKKIMTKGGKTASSNPIFLFDIKKDTYEPDQLQFFKNNYIIPIQIRDADNYIKNTEGVSTSKIETHLDKSNEEFTESIGNDSQILGNILNYLNKKTAKNLSDVFYNENYKIYQKLAFCKDKPTIDIIKEYIKSPLFNIHNLSFTPISAQKIQRLYDTLNSWEESHFVFLFRWCLNNYFSLHHLFNEKQIENITKIYLEKKFYLTTACSFSELLLEYYIDCGDTSSFEEFSDSISSNQECLEIIESQKCKLYMRHLDYEKLKRHLDLWHPENIEKKNALHITTKISSLLYFESFNSSPSANLIESLFKEALKISKAEYQLHYFIYLYYVFFLNCSGKQIPEEDDFINNSVIISNIAKPQNFIQEFSRKQQKQIQPNSKIRFQSTELFPPDNMDLINAERFFNFFEFTNLPMFGILSEQQFIDYTSIYCKDKNNYNLIRLFAHSTPFFGHDTEENFLQTVIPLITRCLDGQAQEILFESLFKIFSFKIQNNQYSRTDFYVMTELCKHVNLEKRRNYYNYFYKIFSAEDNLGRHIQMLISYGRFHGIFSPFIHYLNHIEDEKEFEKIFTWVFQQLLIESSEVSDFNQYYSVLLNKEIFSPILKRFFSSKVIEEKLKNSFSTNIFVSLIAHRYIRPTMKRSIILHLEQNLNLQINPFFFNIFYSGKIKERIFQLIDEKDIRTIVSIETPVTKFLWPLYTANKLNKEDYEEICTILYRKYEKLISIDLEKKASKFEHIFRSHYEFLTTFKQEKDIPNSPIEQRCFDFLKPFYEQNASTLFKFEWIYSTNEQTYRDSFFKCFSYASNLHKEQFFTPYVNIVLSNILNRDEYIQEAILQIFIAECNYPKSPWLRIFRGNQSTQFLITKILEKFMLNIPLCYDDLFIKEKMKDLAAIAKRMRINNKYVDHWLEEPIENNRA